MKRLPTYAAVVAGALALTACGSDDDDSDATASAPSADPSHSVSVTSIDGVGDVLVDQDGMALYTSEEEADGSVLCVDECEEFWFPLEADDGATAAEPGSVELGVVSRPDGTDQVTADGAPLYTFAEDSPGEVTGDGFSDTFGGQEFTWHVALADGGSGAPSDDDTQDDEGGGLDY